MEEKPHHTAKKEPSYFPKLEMLVAIIAVGISAVHYFNWYDIPIFVLDLALAAAGLLLFWVSLKSGFYKRRKEILKRYI